MQLPLPPPPMEYRWNQLIPLLRFLDSLSPPFIHWTWYGSKVGRNTSPIFLQRLTEISQVVWTNFLFMLCLPSTMGHSANSQVFSGIFAGNSFTKPDLFLSSVWLTLHSEKFLTMCVYRLPTLLYFCKCRHTMRIFPRLMTKPIFLYL